MFSRLALALCFAVIPLVPAGAIVTIDASPRALPQLRPAPAVETPAPLPKLSFGEIIAGLAGICVIAVTLLNRRQPHSISS